MTTSILINHLLEPPNRRSGISNYVFSLLGELLNNSDYRYTLATTWSRDQLPERLRDSALQVRTLPFHRQQVVNIAMQAIRLPGLLRRSGAALEFNPNPVGQPFPFRPRVTVVHDLYFETLPHLYPPRHVFWWRRLFPPSLNTARRVICVSNQTRADLLAGHPGVAAKTLVVHEAGGVPVAVNPPAPAGGPYALFVANVAPTKNAAAVVAALAILRERGVPLRVLHVGHDDADRLAAARNQPAGAAGVEALGSVDDARLSALYRHARFLLCPSFWEGFCLPLAEAQAHGTPAVASDIPILREVGGEGALFVNPHDPVALADAMVRLWTDDLLHARLATTARANAARFSWERAARETEAVFRAALASA